MPQCISAAFSMMPNSEIFQMVVIAPFVVVAKVGRLLILSTITASSTDLLLMMNAFADPDCLFS